MADIYIPRMRTLPEAIRELKDLDPDTALTLTALRRKVKTGEIPAVSVGSKRLICLDDLLERLYNPQSAMPETAPQTGIIRRIEA
ncbi:MAG: hypothetical protein LBL82_02235 [Oscillospiraceae bacterium]|jgi:hypothetical protein|nr:hypothetical protein [Oscillospiraceae bacterium]